ncbi:MAG: hypothetical protein U0P45_16580 [Acidimicrobiales bacterium]
MRALVVYESVFGNTHAIAEAIGRGLASAPDVVVEVVPVDGALPDLVAAIDLLVVGGAPHPHGMARESTMEGGVAQEHERVEQQHRPEHAIDEQAHGQVLREWLEALVRPHDDAQAAAFDTRVDGPRLITGSAGHAISKRLRHDGWPLLSDHASFLVDRQNELLEGELARAEAWGASLVGPVA